MWKDAEPAVKWGPLPRNEDGRVAQDRELEAVQRARARRVGLLLWLVVIGLAASVFAFKLLR